MNIEKIQAENRVNTEKIQAENQVSANCLGANVKKLHGKIDGNQVNTNRLEEKIRILQFDNRELKQIVASLTASNVKVHYQH